MRTTTWDAAESSPKGIDPPKRLSFINSLPPHKRATALIRDYIGSRIECQGVSSTEKGLAASKAEKAACRAFLRTWQGIEADGNDMGVQMGVMQAKGMAVQFYFLIPGVGPVTWLPVLVMAANNHTHHIMRESGPNRVAVAPADRGPVDPDSEKKRRIPPKIETTLYRGR